MAWSSFILFIVVLYPVYYGITIFLDSLKKPKFEEEETETFSVEDFSDEETVKELALNDFEKPEEEAFSSSGIEKKSLVTEIQAQSEKMNSTRTEIGFVDRIIDQSFPVDEFRARAKSLANSIQF
jgi:hypothetical protein